MELLSSNAEGVGYLLKDRVADLERFIDAVRRVGEGGSALDPEVVSRLLGRRRQEDPLAEISPRERQVLALMAEGRSNHAIATELVVTERAVEKHVTSIFTKLNLPPTADDHRRVLAVLDLPEGLDDHPAGRRARPRMRGATGAPSDVGAEGEAIALLDLEAGGADRRLGVAMRVAAAVQARPDRRVERALHAAPGAARGPRRARRSAARRRGG